MVKFLIKRPIAVFMATFAFILLGFVATNKIPTALLPNISIPEISVYISYPNQTAREIETNVVRTLRNQLLQVAHLKDIESETRDGQALIKLTFDYGTNTDYAFIETNEKVDGILNSLPRELDRPKVIKASANDIPVLNLTVSLKGEYDENKFLELSNFTETVIKKRIEQLPDIALADMSGQSKAEIVIRPNKEKLISLNIGNDELIQAIKDNNFEFGNLLVQNGIYQYHFKFANPLRTKQDIEQIYLNIHNHLFKLKDLASVELTSQLDRGLVYNNDKRAIVFSIVKQANAQVNSLKNSLTTLLIDLKKDYPELVFNTNQDQTKLLKLSLDNLKQSLLLGSFLAVLIMFFFLKDIKSPLIIAISIPVSLIISILLMYLFGMSINIISLSGLILGVGMMIDNSIIVIDNITKKLENKDNLITAVSNGTSEIITPLVTSVLTTVSVFLPLIFLSGITGALFLDQALAVSIGLGVSLLVSILLIPVIYKQLHNKKWRIEKRFTGKGKINQIENWYEKGYKIFFDKKWVTLSISIIGVLLSVLFFNILKYEKLPDLKKTETVLSIDFNENITVSENQHRLSVLLKELSIEDKQIFSKIGEQQFLLQQEQSKSFSESTVFIKANSLSKIKTIKEELSKKITKIYPNCSFKFENSKNAFEQIFGSNSKLLIAEVSSRSSLEVPEVNKLAQIDSLLLNKAKKDVSLKQTAVIHLLYENMLLYNVSHTNLINELKTAFNQNQIDNLKTAQKFIPIKLKYEVKKINSVINNLFIKNENDKYIPVKNLIKFESMDNYKSIFANRFGEFLPYNILPNIKTEEIDKIISQSDYNTRFSGSIFALKEMNNELIYVVIISILLLYFIMAAQFESLWQPLIILLEIPIDIGGALLLLWLFGGSINVMAIIGIVVMSGIIINDSILKLHTINQLRSEGLSVLEAIKEGGKLRLKPILMTSLTTILALLPFLFIEGMGAKLQKPLALVVIGGLILGTFISLYFIPLMYYIFSRKVK